MKHTLSIFAALLSATILDAQPAKEREFVKTLKIVVTALSTRDSATLAKHTDKKTGVFIVNRIGIMDSYKHYPALGFSDTTYPNLPFYDNVKLTTLKYSRLPAFDCNEEKWSKNGTFVDTTRTSHLLSETAKHLNKEIEGEVPVKKINEFYALENKSRRVVITGENGNELIIYLSYINQRWVLTIIDKVTSDCSA